MAASRVEARQCCTVSWHGALVRAAARPRAGARFCAGRPAPARAGLPGIPVPALARREPARSRAARLPVHGWHVPRWHLLAVSQHPPRRTGADLDRAVPDARPRRDHGCLTRRRSGMPRRAGPSRAGPCAGWSCCRCCGCSPNGCAAGFSAGFPGWRSAIRSSQRHCAATRRCWRLRREPGRRRKRRGLSSRCCSATAANARWPSWRRPLCGSRRHCWDPCSGRSRPANHCASRWCQGAVPQSMKWAPGQRERTMQLYVDLTVPHLGADIIVCRNPRCPRSRKTSDRSSRRSRPQPPREARRW